MKTFLILDGNALLHRAWHAIPPLTATDGTVVNAVYGFANVIDKMLAESKPDYLAVAWDLPGATFRHDAYDLYKAQRKEKEQELYDQIPMIQEMLTAYGIPSLSTPGFEADDVIATLATKFATKDIKAKILTGDRDTFQLVNDQVQVIGFVKGLSQTIVYDAKMVEEKMGVPPERIVDLKAIAGDPSDNLPGVKGIGDKGAIELIKLFGSAEAIIKASKNGKLPPKYQKKMTGQEDTLKQMKGLVELVCDVDLHGFKLADAEVGAPDKNKLIPLFQRWGFRKLLAKYEGGASVSNDRNEAKRNDGASTRLARTVKIDDLKSDILFVHVGVGQTNLFGGSIRSIGLSDGKKLMIANEPDEKSIKKVVEKISSAKLLVGHGLKAMFHALALPVGEDVAGNVPTAMFDTSIAAYLLAPGSREFDLPTVAYERLKLTLKPEANIEEKLPIVIKLHETLASGLKDEGMEKLSTEIEMPLIRVLYLMERSGIEVDRERLKTLSATFAKSLEKLTKKIYKLAGREFNINSPSQLAVVLFDELKLPVKGIKKTQTGYSTAASELEKLWDAHEIIPLMSEYREIAKLQSTYVEALPNLIAPDGRIHTTYNQTIAATGRLSSTDPNLQNIPIRTDLGNEIRKAFVAPKGRVLLAADYSQFELRLASVIAKDTAFMNAFKDGADIHRRTAAEILGKTEAEVTDKERSAAKAINFGVLYGMGPRNLARSTGMKFEEAQIFLTKYFDVHSGIADYMAEMKMKVHNDGYVETLFGRRRYLPDVHSGVGMLVAGAERMAINMPIQGTQADLLKMAMLDIQKWIESEKVDVKMLLQVHDELVFEIDEKIVKEVAPRIRDMMQNVYPWAVPLIVNVEIGKNWGETESI